MPPQGPTAERIAEAYHRYHDLGESYRQIARNMGVTHPTAAAYVREGERAQQNRDLLDQLMAKRSLVALIGELADRGMRLLGPADAEDDAARQRWGAVMPDLRWVVQEAAKMTGAYAATRSEVIMDAASSTAISEALDRRRRDRLEREQREIEDGRQRE